MKTHTLTDICLQCTPHVQDAEAIQTAALVNDLMQELTRIQLTYQILLESREKKLREEDTRPISIDSPYRLI
jgi:hypothetical protein